MQYFVAEVKVESCSTSARDTCSRGGHKKMLHEVIPKKLMNHTVISEDEKLLT